MNWPAKRVVGRCVAAALLLFSLLFAIQAHAETCARTVSVTSTGVPISQTGGRQLLFLASAGAAGCSFTINSVQIVVNNQLNPVRTAYQVHYANGAIFERDASNGGFYYTPGTYVASQTVTNTFDNQTVNADGSGDTVYLRGFKTSTPEEDAVMLTINITGGPAAPAVTGISPTSGPAAGGTAVTITGTDFTGATGVMFGANSGTGVTVDSATQIRATSPAGAAGAVDVTVTTPGGTSATSAADRFTYLSPGTVTPPSYPATADGSTTGSLTMTLSQAPATGLTVTPTGTGLTFSPATITFGAGSTNQSFTVTVGANTGPGAVTVNYALGGADAGLYTTPSAGSFTPLGVFTPPSYPSVARGATSASLTMAASFAPPTGVTITPSGAGLTFSPASIAFTAGQTSRTFTVTAAAGASLGATTVSYSLSGTNSASYVTPASGSLTVTAAALTVIPGAASGTTVGASYSQANPASGGVSPYTYALASGALPAGTSLDTTTGAVSGTPTTAGAFSYAISATDSQAPTVTATGATVSGTIAQGAQTISFTSAAPGAATAGGATYAVTATATSGLAVAFSLDGTSTGCSLAGSTVSFTGAGTCRVNANQAGNANFAAAPQVQQSFTVAAASLSVTPGAASGTSVGGSYSQANPAAGGVAPYSYALASGTLPAGTSLNTTTGSVTGTPTTAGAFSYAIRATDSQAPAVSATGATVSGTIAQGAQTISFTSAAPGAATAGGATYAVTATASSGLTVAFSLDGASTGCSLAGSTVSFTGAGTCRIDANQAGNANFAAAPQAQQSFAVAAASLAVTPGAASGTTVGAAYSQANPATGGVAPYTYALASGALPAGTSLNTTTGAVSGTPTAAGAFSYAIRATDSQAPAVSATGVTVSGTIAQGAQTISFTSAAPGAATAGGATYTVTATATSGLAVAFSLDGASTGCSLAGSTVSFTGAGTCRIDANQAGNANIAAAPQVQQSFAVSAASLSVTPGAASGTTVGVAYSQANPANGGVAPYTYALASGALPAGTSLNTTTGAVTGTPTTAGAFSYAIRATDSQAPAVSATGATVNGTIAQGAQTVSFTSAAPGAATAGGATYTVTAIATSGLAVAFSLDGTSTGCSLAGSTVSFTGAGTCRIDANQAGNANVAAAPQVQQSFAVAAATVAVTPSAPSGTSVGVAYSQTNPASGGVAPYTYALASGALPAGTSLNAGTGEVSGTPTTAGAFSYAIRATDSQNPAASATGATVSGTIAQAGQTITFTSVPSVPATAGGATYAVTATASSGLTVAFSLDGASSGCSLAGSTVSFTGAGTCRINANQAGDANVGAAPQVQQAVTVVGAGLAVTPGAAGGTSVSGAYSQANTASGGIAPYAYALASGALPAGTTLNAATGLVSGTPTTAGAFSYAIRATDSQNPAVNATGATVSGTIAQAAQTITFTSVAPAPATAGGPTYTVTATATSGLTVAFSLDGASSGCSLAGSTVSFTGAGTCRVNANQAGDANVAAAPQAQQAITVAGAVLSVTPGAAGGASVGAAYSQANPASGGVAPYAYALASGALPAGTTLNAATGLVSGTPTTAGAFSYAIRATDSQNPAVSATGATVSGTIAQAGQTITFTSAAPAAATAGGATYSVAATASSGLAVAFSLDPASGGCALAGSTVSFTGAGTCRINANQPGDADVSAAPQVQQSFAVSAASLAVTPGAPGGASVGGSYSQANPASGGVAPYAYALASGALPTGTTLNAATGLVSGTPTTAGAFSYAVRATDSQNPAVSVTGATVSGTIAQAGQTIAFTSTAPAAPMVGGPAYTVAATATSGLAVGFSLDAASSGCALAGNAVTFTGAGTCRIDADQPGDANFAAAPQVQQSFAVGKGDQTIAFAPLPDVQQTASPIALSATASSGLPVAFGAATAAVCTVSGSTLTLVGPGTCTVTTDQAGSAAWNAAPTVSRSFTVSPPPATLAVALTHAGNAVQGGNLDYVATPRSTGGPTAGTLTAAFTLPAGVSYVGATGSGWSCSGSGSAATCTSTAVIAAGGSGAAITLTAAFAPNAGSPLAPSVTLSGGGAAASASASDATVVQAPAPVAGPVAATVPYQTATAIDLTPGLSGGPRTSVTATQGAHGATSINGDVVTYTPAAGYSGSDSFTYTATGPGGTSAPGTVTVTVSPPPVPTAPAREVSVLAGRPITVDLTAGASGGPFVSAAVLSTSPVDAGDIRLVESGPAGNHSYALEFTSRATFAGAATISYTISNAGGASQPLRLTVNVAARPDPSRDPEVRAIGSAETGAVRRFASGQIRNFARRLEQLHGEGGGGNSFGVSIAPGIAMPMVARPNPLAANDPTQPGRTDGRGNNLAGALGRYVAMSGQAGSSDSIPAAATEDSNSSAVASAADDSGGGARAVGGIALWANGTITVGRRDETTGRAKLTMSTSGITGGADMRIAPWATVGIGVGFGHDSTDIGDNGSKLSTGSWSIGGYGSFQPAPGAFIDVLAGFGGFDLAIDRFVTGTGSMATGQRDANLLFGSVTAGIDREARRLRWSLYGGLEGSRAKLGSYAEVGPVGYSLVYDKRTLESLSGLVGGRFRVDIVEGDLRLTPRGRFEYRYDFEQANGQRVRFGDWLSGPSYLIDADGWSRSTFSTEIGLGLRTRDGWQFGGDVIGNLSGNSRSIGLRLEINKEF